MAALRSMIPRPRLDLLGTRLLAAFFAVAVLPLGVIGLLVYRHGETTLTSEACHRLASVTEFKGQQIEEWVRERRSDVVGLVAIPSVQRHVAAFMRRAEGREEPRPDADLRRSLAVLGREWGFSEILLLRPSDGQVMISTDPEREGKFREDRPYFREGLKGVFFQRVHYSLPAGRAVMAFSAPVPDRQGAAIAVLVGQVDISFFDRLMGARVGLGATGRTFLVNRFNHFVSETVGHGELGRRPVFNDGVRRVLAGQTGTARYVNHEGRAVVAAYRWLANVELGLVAEMDRDEAFAPLGSFRVTLLWALALVTLAAVLLGTAFCYGITRPVSRVVSAVRAIGGGDLAHRVDVKRPAELAILASAVNRMADDLEASRRELETYSQTLERRVEERTAESEARRRVAESLADVARVLSQSLDPDVVGRLVVDNARRLFAAIGVTLYRLERESGDLVALAVSGDVGPAWDGTVVLRRGDGVAGLAAQDRRPVTSTDVLADPRVSFLPSTRDRIERAPFRAALAVPLLLADRAIGVLAVVDGAGRVFDDEQIRMAEAMASQAALALDNARLYREAQDRLGRVQRLTGLSHLVTSSLDVQGVLDAVTESALDLVDADLAHAWVVDKAAGVLRLAALKGCAEGPPPLTIGTELPLRQGIVGWVVEQRRKRYSPDLSEDPLQVQTERGTTGPYASQIALPLMVVDDAVGALAVLTRAGRGFSAEEQDLLELFAAHAATALRNARLYHEAQRAYEELSRAQAQLVQAQRMEVVGQLAGGVAHDFNNLLTVINGRAQMALGQLQPGDLLWRHIDLIKKTGDRAVALTKQLLAFSRRQILEPRVLDLNLVVPGMASLLERLIGEHIELVFRPAPDLGHVRVDPGQLEQVIMNLVINARDAMPRGGRIILETANVEAGERHARDLDGQPGAHVLLAVSDTGVGMDADTQARIFEPFFTTKEPGKGTGLGLSTVYGIVEQSGGIIRVDSESGRGTTFRIYLPRVEGLDDVRGDLEARRRHRGSETVLVVEDEDQVRALAQEILEDYGYRVLVASRPAEALAIAERHSAPIHVLLTDIVMPEMNGRVLAERLASVRPEMSVLYMSGYTDSGIIGHGTLIPGGAFIHKPFTPDALADKVRGVLDGLTVERPTAWESATTAAGQSTRCRIPSS